MVGEPTAQSRPVRSGAPLLLAALGAGCLLQGCDGADRMTEPAPEEFEFVRREQGPLIFTSRRKGIPPIRIEIPCRHEFESDAGKDYDLHYAYCVADDGSGGEAGIGFFVGRSPVTFHDRAKHFVDKDRREVGGRELLWYRWEETDDDGNVVLMRETVLDDFFEEYYDERGEKAPRRSRNEDLHVWIFGSSMVEIEPLMAAVSTITVAPAGRGTIDSMDAAPGAVAGSGSDPAPAEPDAPDGGGGDG